MEILSKLPELLSLKPSRLVVVALATSALLFLPNPVLVMLGLSGFVNDFRPWIGGSLVLSSSGLVVALLSLLFVRLKERFDDWLLEREFASLLRGLTPEEKALLADLLKKNSRTQAFSPMDGVVASLERQGVIAQLTNVSYGLYFQYGVQPWAWRYLQAHPEVLGVAREQLERPAA